MLQPSVVRRFLGHEEFPAEWRRFPAVTQRAVVPAIRTYVSRYHVGAVIVDVTDPTVANVGEVLKLLNETLGPQPWSAGSRCGCCFRGSQGPGPPTRPPCCSPEDAGTSKSVVARFDHYECAADEVRRDDGTSQRILKIWPKEVIFGAARTSPKD